MPTACRSASRSCGRSDGRLAGGCRASGGQRTAMREEPGAGCRPCPARGSTSTTTARTTSATTMATEVVMDGVRLVVAAGDYRDRGTAQSTCSGPPAGLRELPEALRHARMLSAGLPRLRPQVLSGGRRAGAASSGARRSTSASPWRIDGVARIRSALDGFGPCSGCVARSRHALHVAGRRLGLGVVGTAFAARPADQPVEQRAPARDERDANSPNGGAGTRCTPCSGPSATRRSPGRTSAGDEDERTVGIRGRLRDDLDALEARTLERDARACYGGALVPVDDTSGPRPGTRARRRARARRPPRSPAIGRPPGRALLRARMTRQAPGSEPHDDPGPREREQRPGPTRWADAGAGSGAAALQPRTRAHRARSPSRTRRSAVAFARRRERDDDARLSLRERRRPDDAGSRLRRPRAPRRPRRGPRRSRAKRQAVRRDDPKRDSALGRREREASLHAVRGASSSTCVRRSTAVA